MSNFATTVSNIYVDRKKASKLLKVSTRTIDRYIRRYKIKIRKENRKIFIKESDINRIINDHINHFLGNFKRLKDNGQFGQDVHNDLAVKDIKVESIRTKEDGVYKELYLELKKELKERQDRLEAATYRVGQLESQVKNMVPLLEYNRKDKELKEAQILLENRVTESQQALTRLRQVLLNERVAKWAYLSLIGLLLVAEPILFLFWAFS